MKTIPTVPSKWIESLKGPILVTGAKGMLGWEWTERLRALKIPSVPLGRAELDVTNESQVREVLTRHKPSVVVHCAAYTNVDKAESERDAATLSNGVSPGLIAKACDAVHAKLVHYSTDQVFDGSGQTLRTETEKPRPLNHYGASKLEGEHGALQSKEALVLRVQWLYGEKKDRFTPLRQKERFTPFKDQFGAPTWTRDIVDVSLALLSRGERGLFHLSHDDYASWAQVFERVKTRLHLTALKLEPKATAEFNLPAARPLFSVLSNRKLCAALGVEDLGPWSESLDAFLALVDGKNGKA